MKAEMLAPSMALAGGDGFELRPVMLQSPKSFCFISPLSTAFVVCSSLIPMTVGNSERAEFSGQEELGSVISFQKQSWRGIHWDTAFESTRGLHQREQARVAQ